MTMDRRGFLEVMGGLGGLGGLTLAGCERGRKRSQGRTGARGGGDKARPGADAGPARPASQDAGAARAQLRWVIDKSGHPELVQIARLRLAGVLLDEKSHDEALTLLGGDVPPTLAVSFADRRGDVLMAMGKAEEARTAYREALDKADPQHPLRPIIQLKLDALPPPAAS